MIEPKHRQPPKHWRDFRQSIRHRWLMPFLFADWIVDWAAYQLSRSSLLEFLEYCGSFSILIGVILYFLDAPERTKTKHYQAWQVINTAQGKGGSGGRADALHELNEDHVPLVGVDLSDAFLQGLHLRGADLRRGNLHGADLKDSDLSGSKFEQSMMDFANLRNGNLTRTNFTDASMKNTDLTNADLTGSSLHNTDLESADLTDANLMGVKDWKTITGIKEANIHGIRNAPEGFIAWATSSGAVDQPPR
jgi:uncharacterized protein YjbI with pentapeptide repeats